MKSRLLGILILLAMVGHLLMPLAITSYFELNQARITEEFCINKSRPMLNCNGHCYLATKLAAMEQGAHQENAENLALIPGIVPLFWEVKPGLQLLSHAEPLPLRAISHLPVAPVLNMPVQPPEA